MGKIELQSFYEDICQLLDEVENDSDNYKCWGLYNRQRQIKQTKAQWIFAIMRKTESNNFYFNVNKEVNNKWY